MSKPERGLNDPDWVREQYADEQGLETRQAVYGSGAGEPFDVALAAFAEIAPRRILEVGGGQGFFAERLRDELGAAVVGIDVSERMVELQRQRGIDAQVGDVQELPFADASFDAVSAQYMLYHVPDLPRGLAEIARVLRPGGRLVAITNAVEHLRELWALVGRDRRAESTFNDENGEELLRQCFSRVVRRYVRVDTTFPDEASVRAYLASSARWRDVELPAFETPLHTTAVSAVFLAE
jgi:ubiquinone/menaquinone biosynthesis C-methylase UbiE